MEEYIKKYEHFEKKIVYDFKLGDGGIGDCIKFFMYVLELCIQNDYKLYYLINDIMLEKYIKLKFAQMYISKTELNNSIRINNTDELNDISNDKYYIVHPSNFYQIFEINHLNKNLTINIRFEDVFEFSNEVKVNSSRLFPSITQYISIHLRLGDIFLETDQSFVQSQNDVREFSYEKICNFIENNSDKNILFLCDNNRFKLKIKEKYDNIIITNSNIGHTSLLNTTEEQVLDTVSEFYLLTNSEQIYSASYSGFSIVASKFKNVPLHHLTFETPTIGGVLSDKL